MISKFFITVGSISLFIGTLLILQRINPYRLAFSYHNSPKNGSDIKKENLPVRIRIKTLGIDLPVIPTKARSGPWDTTSEGVSWLATSSIPGERGNSILYGHNWSNLLGNLTNARPGEKIQIFFKDGSQKTFNIESLANVYPNNTQVLNPSKDHRITLYTCSGFFDTKRFVVAALMEQ